MNSQSPNSIYIVGNVHSSKEEYYPSNTVGDFWIKLSKPLILTGAQWKVGLCEIHVFNVLLEDRRDENRPLYFQVDFGPCDGLVVDGQSTHTVRVLPYSSNVRKIFTDPFYVPVQIGYIESCHIHVKLLPHVKLQDLENLI